MSAQEFASSADGDAAAPQAWPAAADGRMRPLVELPADELKGLHGVLTDIDDTLTRDGAIEPAALAALHALDAAGVPVVAITGRPAGWSEPFALSWPVRAIVAENGGVMLRRDGETLVRSFTVDDSTRAQLFKRLADCAGAVLAEVPGTTLAQDSPGRFTDIAVDHSEFCTLDAGRIAQVVAVMRRHGLTATVSSIHINGWIGEHNKWTAARWAVEAAVGMSFDPQRWLYVGDSTNDQLMFERMPLTVGVANIARFVSQLKAWPAWLTQAERGEGFAELATTLLADFSAARGAD